MHHKYIVTNFAYGTGPYLMTTKLAAAFNDELERAGQPRMGIIVPWVYGEKQKRIMAEEFSGYEKKYPGELILDAGLGGILEKVFYGGTDYETYLKKWTANFKEVSREANAYLSARYGSDIAVELNRSPRLLYGVAPAYSTSFGHMSQIFEKSLEVPVIKIQKELLQKAAEISKCIEREQQIQAVAYPGVFSWAKDYQPVHKGEVLAPPIGPMPRPDTSEIEKGIYVTKTGIPGLERLYGKAEKLGLKIYSNGDHNPNLITNQTILLHFARSGWASVWFSLLAEKPIIVPEYDSADDPEIYFNNLAIEKTGIGIVYREEPLKELLKKSEHAKRSCQQTKKEILERWGTLDGTGYCAAIFARDFLKR